MASACIQMTSILQKQINYSDHRLIFRNWLHAMCVCVLWELCDRWARARRCFEWLMFVASKPGAQMLTTKQRRSLCPGWWVKQSGDYLNLIGVCVNVWARCRDESQRCLTPNRTNLLRSSEAQIRTKKKETLLCCCSVSHHCRLKTFQSVNRW